MPLLRSCSVALATALEGGVPLWSADLFSFGLANGHSYYFTSWQSFLTIGDFTYLSAFPWLTRSRWNVTYTMEVPELEIRIDADNTSFASGGNLKLQAHNGLFDGATVGLSRVFMSAPDNTSTLGTVDLFFGDVGAASIIGTSITLKVKGRNNRLDVPAPRNTYQPGCLHTFCDSGCTLSRAAFLTTYAVGTSPAPSRTFLPFPSTPTLPGRYVSGTVTFLTGANAGLIRTVVACDTTGFTLASPLLATPATGDTFSAFQGCNKTIKGDGATAGTFSCTNYSNTLNFRGFPFIPSPSTMAKGQF